MHTLRDLATAAVACIAAVVASPCFADAQRTFVATTGADANTSHNCGLVYPCRSFAAALSVTANGGEIVVLDSGGYGPVTIDKSVALVAPPGVYAGISVLATTPGTTGIVVNAGASGFVTLRGLSLVNVSGGSATGIRILSAAHVRVEGSALDGFFTGVVSSGNSASVAIADTTIRGSDLGAGPMGAAVAVENMYDARLVVTRSVINNARTGIYAAGVHHVEITDTTIAYCEFTAVRAHSYAGQPDNGSVVLERLAFLANYIAVHLSADAPRQTVANVRNSTVSGNDWGFVVDNGGYLRVAGTQVTANHIAIEKTGTGVVYSLGDNLCAGNDAPCIAATPIVPY